MLHWYIESGSRVLLVDDAHIVLGKNDKLLDLTLESCRLTDVVHLGGGIYDAIVFPTRPPKGILKRAFEKVYWGGIVIIQGIESIVKDAGYQVLKGDPEMLVLRRPPAPPDWSREYYLEFQPKGKYWNAKTKQMHPSYEGAFKNIRAEWENARVIEYGCGRGEITRQIALAGASLVVVVDSAPEAIALTEEFCDDLDNVATVWVEALELEPNEFQCQDYDVVVAIDFVEHLSEQDLQKLMGLWYNSLVEGGLVHIVTPLGPDHVRDHKWHPTPKKLKEKMKNAGFEEKRRVRPEGSRKFLAEFVRGG